MKKNYFIPLFAFCLLLIATSISKAHSVQVGYCVSCTGELTLYVEHWHGAADPSSTTMTIQLNINGTVTTQTGSPIDNIQDTPFSELPGCTNPINIFAACQNEKNTYNDWVVFKFPNLPTNVPVIITINSGNTVFTEDGCNMYPASTPTIIVPPIINPPPIADSSRSICVGESAVLNLTNYFDTFQWQSAPTPTGPWTDIPGATTTPYNTGIIDTTTHYRAISPGTCESNYVTITVHPAVVPTSGLGPGTGTGAGNDTALCPSSTPVNIGTPTTPTYTYSWLPTTGLSSTTISNPTAAVSTPNTTTTYTLTTRTDFGCTSIDSVTVTVKEIPTSNAGTDVSECTSGTPAAIGASSTAGYTYSWSPSTGLSSSTVSNPNVDLTTPGTSTYTVTTTYDGCVSSDSVTVVVNPMPVANFNFEDVCHQQAIDFVDASTIVTDVISSWTWDFGSDNSPISNLQSPSYTYDSPNIYTVELLVETNNGCIDSISKTVVVHPNPVAVFTFSNRCDGLAIPLTDYSTIAAPDYIQNWIWDFDDSTANYSGQTVANGHLYSAPGDYDVELKTTSNFGCTDSVTHTVFVNPNPVVAFSSVDTTGCDPLCIEFENQSTILTGTNASWLIDFGDGSAPSSTELTHCYTNFSPTDPQSFTPVLIVYSDSGCVSTLPKNDYITVFPNPIADFTIEPSTVSIVNPIVDINNISSGADFWNWDFGDLTTSTLAFPEPHTYADTGTFLITLITSTQFECYDTAYQTVVVEPETVFYVPNVFSPNGDGKNDTFFGKGMFVMEYDMKIYNRWGEEIFYTNNIDIPWDGTVKGGTEMAQQDVYIYVINIKDIARKKRSYKGTVTLVK